MLGSGAFLFISLTLFVLYAVLMTVENRRGRRILLTRFRDWLDFVLVKITEVLSFWLRYIGRHMIKLSWYYGIHRFLKFLLTILVKSYDHLEGLFLRNRDRAKMIKKEKKIIMHKNTHFDKIVDHKESTALSEAEKKKLLKAKLERD